ncbi:MAG TPA: lysophospholipid acyltransferase family protein [bacterium]|nr:lysophospholipid acyltransferase family protein [bacterium]
MKKKPESMSDIMRGKVSDYVLDRIDRLPFQTSASEDHDEFGFSRDALKKIAPAAYFLYEKWFRTEIFGIENIPSEGPVLIIPNHSGQIPLDGLLIATGVLSEAEPPRLPRAMVERWFPTLPGLSIVFARSGQVVGVMRNAEKLLDQERIVLIFPEGIRGSGKLWQNRYQVQQFTLGFMELAIKYKARIVPAAVIGGEEQAPAFYNIEWLAKKTGMPYFPLTPTFPWFGLLGLIPYPSKYRIYFGETMDFSEYENELNNPDKIRELADLVHDRVQEMVDEKKDDRPFPGL